MKELGDNESEKDEVRIGGKLPLPWCHAYLKECSFVWPFNEKIKLCSMDSSVLYVSKCNFVYMSVTSVSVCHNFVCTHALYIIICVCVYIIILLLNISACAQVCMCQNCVSVRVLHVYSCEHILCVCTQLCVYVCVLDFSFSSAVVLVSCHTSNLTTHNDIQF